MSQIIGYGLSILYLIVIAITLKQTCIDDKHTTPRLVLTLIPSMLAPTIAAAVSTKVEWYIIPSISFVIGIMTLIISQLVHRTAAKIYVPDATEVENQHAYHKFILARTLSYIAVGFSHGAAFALYIYAVNTL